jgi:hypothetical protein
VIIMMRATVTTLATAGVAMAMIPLVVGASLCVRRLRPLAAGAASRVVSSVSASPSREVNIEVGKQEDGNF